MTQLQKTEKTTKMKKKTLHKRGVFYRPVFLQNHKKTEMETFAFWVITFEPNKI